ncbi:MAG: DUF4150 domain-containing protein [Xanthomonadaceae bacterium]|jgi:hypothetical protein|nr:DUF4150 domain-containing protein [Xanthomonadaceae bacterium]
MAENIIARNESGWMVVSLSPDVCKTPMGGIPVPVPYQVTSNLSQAVQTANQVSVNSYRPILYDQTKVPNTDGDDAGVQLGVKSGTVKGDCWPIQHSSTVKFEGKQIIRHDDLFWMNGRK